MSDKIYVGQKCTTFRSMGEYPPVSRVTMWTDDEHYYTAGDDTGYEISVPCRSAKQEIVDAALKQLKGFVYRPFEATGVAIDPAYELGDAVTINGIYSFIGQDTRHFNAMGLSDISCPGEREIDHEYPYKSPQERELKRRVKLEQAYFGAKISRREGLVIEKLEQEIIKARVVLNAEKLAFYGPNNEEQLYFDPVEGIYKFCGALNVSDKFLVDKLGNMTAKGNLNLSEASEVTFGKNAPTKKQFSVSASGPWHKDMETADKWRQDWDYFTEAWGTAYQFRGTDGAPGSPANVTFNNILSALQKAEATKSTFITADEVGAPTIYGATIYGAKIYAGGVDNKGGQIIALTDKGIQILNGAGKMVLGVGEVGGEACFTTGYTTLSMSAPFYDFGGFNNMTFSGGQIDFTKVDSIDFTGVTTKGIHFTLA